MPNTDLTPKQAASFIWNEVGVSFDENVKVAAKAKIKSDKDILDILQAQRRQAAQEANERLIQLEAENARLRATIEKAMAIFLSSSLFRVGIQDGRPGPCYTVNDRGV